MLKKPPIVLIISASNIYVIIIFLLVKVWFVHITLLNLYNRMEVTLNNKYTHRSRIVFPKFSLPNFLEHRKILSCRKPKFNWNLWPQTISAPTLGLIEILFGCSRFQFRFKHNKLIMLSYNSSRSPVTVVGLSFPYFSRTAYLIYTTAIRKWQIANA